MNRITKIILGAIALFVLIAPATATAQTNNNVSASASITYMPYVSLRGATYDAGSVNKNGLSSNTYDPRTGNGTSSFTRTTELIKIEPARKPMMKFDGEVISKKTNFGVAVSGWKYTGDTASTNGLAGNGDSLNIWQQSMYSEGGAEYSASSSWKMDLFEAGLTYKHEGLRTTTKFSAGGMYTKMGNDNSLSEAHQYNSFSEGEKMMAGFGHEEVVVSSTGNMDFKGFGPQAGVDLTAHVGPLNLHSSTKVGYVFGEQTEKAEWKYQSEYSFWYGVGQKAGGNSLNKGSIPLNTSTKVAMSVFQQELGASLKLWKLEVGTGFYVASFHGLADQASYNGMLGSWGKSPASTTPTLVGATATIKLVF
ncbi:MAG: hypothetical protein KBC81_02770 [Candidatus Pacebacteria bacterium]|nr:hypothetical protein [Candidatus Paceibacterota bacterium]